MEDMIFPLDLFFDRVVREMHIKKFGMRREGFIDGPDYKIDYAEVNKGFKEKGFMCHCGV